MRRRSGCQCTWRVKTFFFWRSLDFGQKNAVYFGEDQFFWRLLDFGQKNAVNFGGDLLFFLEITWFWTEKRSKFASIQFKTNEHSGQVRLRLNQTSKKAPLPLRNPGYATDRHTIMLSQPGFWENDQTLSRTPDCVEQRLKDKTYRTIFKVTIPYPGISDTLVLKMPSPLLTSTNAPPSDTWKWIT